MADASCLHYPRWLALLRRVEPIPRNSPLSFSWRRHIIRTRKTVGSGLSKVNRGMADATSGGRPMVRFVNVQKSYDGETLVIKNLNLDIAKGEFVTMLGPSGSGKTTTLLMLAGFEPATHGEIFLNGQPINKLPPHRRGIGMVFQNYALFPHMTVNENLAFPLQVRRIGKAEIEERVKNVLEMVELPTFGYRRP